jgi:hypothetical protein
MHPAAEQALSVDSLAIAERIEPTERVTAWLNDSANTLFDLKFVASFDRGIMTVAFVRLGVMGEAMCWNLAESAKTRPALRPWLCPGYRNLIRLLMLHRCNR